MKYGEMKIYLPMSEGDRCHADIDLMISALEMVRSISVAEQGTRSRKD